MFRLLSFSIFKLESSFFTSLKPQLLSAPATRPLFHWNGSSVYHNLTYYRRCGVVPAYAKEFDLNLRMPALTHQIKPTDVSILFFHKRKSVSTFTSQQCNVCTSRLWSEREKGVDEKVINSIS